MEAKTEQAVSRNKRTPRSIQRIFKLYLSLVQFTPRGDNQKISPGEQRNLRRIVAEEPWFWDQRVNAHGNLRLNCSRGTPRSCIVPDIFHSCAPCIGTRKQGYSVQPITGEKYPSGCHENVDPIRVFAVVPCISRRVEMIGWKINLARPILFHSLLHEPFLEDGGGKRNGKTNSAMYCRFYSANYPCSSRQSPCRLTIAACMYMYMYVRMARKIMHMNGLATIYPRLTDARFTTRWPKFFFEGADIQLTAIRASAIATHSVIAYSLSPY
ncbi:uncharacterized protein BDCG_01512 [Blastomyces dermatitidis ER-3]|nr:uncharacterized protein BDCG_01512 [Blastomyces dermatitidis ER-3]EEQ86392.2 hypothetical protein BDCG_01512 [Blastomyces dermatitidis ER-3]